MLAHNHLRSPSTWQDVGEVKSMQKTEHIHFYHRNAWPTSWTPSLYGRMVKLSCNDATRATQYIATRIKVELACDSIRKQGQSVNAKFGICDSKVNDVSEDNHKIAQSLLAEWTDSGAPLLCAPRRFPQTCSMRVIPLSEL